MPALAPIGHLAVTGLPQATQVQASGRLSVRANLRTEIPAFVSGKLSTRVHAKAGLGLALSATLTVRAHGRLDKFSLPGAGKSYTAMPWLPQPAYEEPSRQKPFQPIWDRRRQKENEEAARKAAEPPPLPPQDIFSVPGKITVRLDYLPDYSKLVPGDWEDIGPAAKEAMDASDAEMVLRQVVEAEVKDAADAVSAIQQLADEIMRQALEQAAQTRQQPASPSLQIGIPARPGTASYDEQMHDVSDHADAMAALRESGLIPEEV